ncbi:Fic family protein [Bifidobacterium bombi]|uniref:Fic family protein n=1 Tax=Bifidobacterium bombi TaxID=471511 RepID=UPI0006949166|nr:Fic family protein [Bifidobacterium bombi]
MNRIDWTQAAPVLVLEDNETTWTFAEILVDANNRLTGKRLSADGVNDYFRRSLHQRQVEKVASVILAVFGVQFGQTPQERHPDMKDAFDQVSLLAEYLAKDHYFTDGNKRTTMLAVLGLLRARGIRINVDDSSNPDDNFIYRWIQGIVTHDHQRYEFASALRRHAELDVDE